MKLMWIHCKQKKAASEIRIKILSVVRARDLCLKQINVHQIKTECDLK